MTLLPSVLTFKRKTMLKVGHEWIMNQGRKVARQFISGILQIKTATGVEFNDGS